MMMRQFLAAACAACALYATVSIAERTYRVFERDNARHFGAEFTYTTRADGVISATINFAASGHHYVLPKP